MEHRILIVDDNGAIHEDFNKILAPGNATVDPSLKDARAAFFGSEDDAAMEDSPQYRLDSAYQGQDALEMVKAAIEEKDPYSMAFVDVRMPPGWDGVQTIQELWKVAPDLECVICTAFSDYTWADMARTLGQSDKLLILKKPFDPVEARQFASTLTTKWQTLRDQETTNGALVIAEHQAKAYASSLETVNQALRTSKATADKAAQMRGEFLRRLSEQVSCDLTQLLEATKDLPSIDPHLASSLELGHTLLNTVTGVLEFTSLESGDYATQTETAKPSELLAGVVRSFEERASKQGRAIGLDLGSGLDGAYMVDGTSVSRLVELLVDNSLRHGGQGKIQVKAWVERSENWAKPSLHVQVTDAGPGLPQSYERQMFEPLTSPRQGSRFGIGLALAKQLVQTMGGDLGHKAVEPHGSQFHFNVKLTEASSIDRAA